MNEIVDVNLSEDKVVRPRILVTGSRSLDIRRYDHPSRDLMVRCNEAKERFLYVLEDWVSCFSVTDAGLRPVVIVHGGAKFGADNWAQLWVYHAWDSAKISRDVLHSERHRADWDRYGKAAGMHRNGVMVDSMDPTKPHVVLACWDGTSSGTKNTIDRATLAGLDVVRTWR